MTKAVIPAKLLLRNLYRNLATKSNWDSDVYIDRYCEEDLRWWLSALKSWNGAPLNRPEPQVQLRTHTSGTGWGNPGAW